MKDLFDEHYYADLYKDLKEAYGYDREALWNHYVQHGLNEGRSMNGLLDVKKYREQYADLNAAFGDNWDAYINHYLTMGAKEGRENGTGNGFNAIDYAARNADVKAAFWDDVLAIWKHYQAVESQEASPEKVIEAQKAETVQKPQETSTLQEIPKPQENPKPAAYTKSVTGHFGGLKIEEYDESGRLLRYTDHFIDGTVIYYREYGYYEDGRMRSDILWHYNLDGSLAGCVASGKFSEGKYTYRMYNGDGSISMGYDIESN